VRTRHCLTAADVRVIAEAGRLEAQKNGWAVTIAVVDDGGHLLHLERLDARVTTVDVAVRKARTAALTRQPTAAFEQRARANPVLMALDALPLQGGLPLEYGGDFVGGIGVSGVLAPQDEQVAGAGVAALAALQPK
jgi:glc operon protein GlcG